MSEVRCICAIGRAANSASTAACPGRPAERAYVEDVERFSRLTRGHVVIAGPATINSVPDWARADRTFVPSARASRRKRCSPAIPAGWCSSGAAGGVGSLCPLHPPLGHHPPAL